MVVLIDSDVLMDYISHREHFYENAQKIIDLRIQHKFYGYVTTQSISNLYYILRKKLDEAEKRYALLRICRLFRVVAVFGGMTISALVETHFKDFEDRLQMLCARHEKVDYIVTRNIKHYKDSEVPVLTPDAFLKIVEK
jgi:predicted nucleic acid-binding protein